MYYFASITLFLLGISVIKNPLPHKNIFGVSITGDVTKIKWELGLSFMLIGIILAYSEYKKKKKPQYSICPKCKETYLYKDLKDGKCPTCKVDTVDIDKYYNNKSNKGKS